MSATEVSFGVVDAARPLGVAPELPGAPGMPGSGGVPADADSTVVLRTERLVVRPWRLEEAERFFDIYRRSEVVRWIGAEPMQDRREAIEMIQRNLTRLEADSRFGSWAVVDRSSAVPVGSVILKPLPDGAGEVEIGWQMHPDSWGKGFASEAARALLERGFADALPEVWAVMYLDNHRSAAVCGRIGMRLLGVTNRWYHEPSLMFWIGSSPDREPSLMPEGPAPTGPCWSKSPEHREHDGVPGSLATTSIMDPGDVVIRTADDGDVGAIATLRSLWSSGHDEPDFEHRMAAWLAAEGARRTVWLATLRDLPIGMASVFEYRRMPRPGRPDSPWGYVSNMFVRKEFRDRGVGSRLMACIITAAEEHGYARLVVSPSPRALAFYRRAGFIIPDDTAGDHRLLVRPTPM